ncbi:hypothetical protein BDZ45DRAFT_804107 [Acephala macrosclerotiorum]|nr:hypothetical protein BDZ45DRAFT_804107 [Acephala macrosclerotiorum]
MPSPRRLFLTGLILGVLVLRYHFFGVLFGKDGKFEITLHDSVKHAGHGLLQNGDLGSDVSTSLKSSDASYTRSTSSLTSEVVPQATSSVPELVLQTSSTLEVALTPTSTHPAPLHPQNVSVSPEDILLIIKTGADTIWRRMPLHLTTLLNNRIPNTVIYSDLNEQLSSTISAIDALANVSSIIQEFDPSAYDVYIDQQSERRVNTYREQARLPGDEPPDEKPENQPGWLLDKYKFLPMLAHAQKNWPGLKWYIYIEDDTYIFTDNVLKYLTTLESDDEPSYYGAYSGEGNATFAQGGSGLVFSRSLMSSIFSGDSVPTLEKYGNETSQACCGDTMLGKILRDYGVYVNRRTYGTASFRPEPPWKTGFNDLIWCTPVFTFHHLHQRDMVQLSEIERKQKELGRPVVFRDVYMALIDPYLKDPMISDWDNFASRYILIRNFSAPFHDDLRDIDFTVLNTGPLSPQYCRKACQAVESCMGWRHDSGKGTCGLDTVVKFGREQEEWEVRTTVTSGWMVERIERLLLRERCEVVRDPYT